jgi:hypothetical protein
MRPPAPSATSRLGGGGGVAGSALPEASEMSGVAVCSTSTLEHAYEICSGAKNAARQLSSVISWEEAAETGGMVKDTAGASHTAEQVLCLGVST